jgi:putative (di)nucleoside polyphosphate hydrolase
MFKLIARRSPRRLDGIFGGEMRSVTESIASLPDYRPCVGIMAVNRAGLVWIGRRILTRRGADRDRGGFEQWWQMPQGGIDAGEAPDAAALRELCEETGMCSVEVLGRTQGWLTYDLPPALVPANWGGKYRGQAQLWYAVRFLGDDDEINILPQAGHSQEFDAWRWAAVDELIDLIVPFKRDVYTRALGELAIFARPA